METGTRPNDNVNENDYIILCFSYSMAFRI